MPSFLAFINLVDVTPLLRSLYMQHNDTISRIVSYSEILQLLSKNIQRARYEQLILNLASAYEGYTFYLPAFLDFRGRIYRCGILHFHERDLARSLIVFAGDDEKTNTKVNSCAVISAFAFHYKSFESYDNCIEWFMQELYDLINNNDSNPDPERLYKLYRFAKRPFQYLSHFLRWNEDYECHLTPITQDASASAYQIMSYLLLDEFLAEKTNLIPSLDGKIQDVYSYISNELKSFLKDELVDNNLSSIVCNNLDRKIVKKIFMPMIYGKTVMSTASDLKEHLSHYITHKECFTVASACFKFWRSRFNGMESF
uniref:DNA-directed RNA polymerase n=1 Tax=Mirabilis himalaica TaxID=482968 RepID=A0A6M9TTE7_9CARY|nr:ORF312 [Mirabilis himalaica]QKN19356.1 ORF312 [Mirabilis himalaica]